MHVHVRAAVVLVLALDTGACGLLPDGVLRPGFVDLEPCTSIDATLEVGGEASGIDGVVAIVTSESDDRVSLSITPADDSLVHTATFGLAGAEIDALVGEVTAEVGVVFAGEGHEYGYLRLMDERGVWFEGGRSPSIDGEVQGGGAIDGPFALGEPTGNECRSGGDDGYGVAVHNVLGTLSDGSEPVLLDSEGTSGSWRGVDVRAVGVRAHRGVYEESSDTADGFGPGQHDLVEVVGYVYRAAP